MLWLIAALSAYFILAVVFLVDKYLLAGPIPSPKVYAFYVGILGAFALALIPLVGFSFPGTFQIILSFLAGSFFILGLFWFYKALSLFEPSRVVPAIGGILPMFTFTLVYIFSRGEELPTLANFLSFLLLILGSVLIAYERSKKVTRRSLLISVLAAFFLALCFVLSKYVYLAQPFWSGFIWIRIGGVLAALCLFVFLKEVRNEIFARLSFSSKNFGGPKKTAGLFLLNQAMGGGANILQNWAIALVPLALVAVINALAGVQYAFLLVLAVLLSVKFPKILNEEISKEIIFQKVIAVLLIGAGLAILALR